MTRRTVTARLGETAVEHQVPFHDVDLTKRVWHGHYFKYFEIARTALFRAHGLEDGSLIPGRFSLYVIETRCRYTSPLRYGDRFCASAWFRDIDHRLAIDYEVTNLTHGKRAARGHTLIAVTDRDGRLLLRTPPEVVRRISEATEAL